MMSQAPRAGAFALIVFAYALCIAAGAGVLALVEIPAPWDLLLADVAATLVIFGFSRAYKNSSFYDAYWSVLPPLFAVWWMITHGMTQDLRAIIVTTLVWLWGIRLTANWATFWGGLSHEDWRYPLVRGRAGKAELWADLGGIHLFPTFIVFAGCLPVFAVMSLGGAPLGPLDYLAAVVTFGAVLIELIADLQLHRFISRKKKPGEFITTGLWAWSRHPNYFGEVSFWWGLMLFGLAAAPQAWWWIMPGAIAMACMFVFASIPLMDERSCARRPAYREHMQRVSALIPLPPRRR